MKTLTVVLLTATTLLVACGGTVETSSCGPSGCTSSLSGPVSSQPVGGACRNDGECAGSMVCLTGAPNGYCTQGCRSSADCPTGGLCVSAGSRNICFKSCTSGSDCRPGYVCETLTNGKGICSER